MEGFEQAQACFLQSPPRARGGAPEGLGLLEHPLARGLRAGFLLGDLYSSERSGSGERERGAGTLHETYPRSQLPHKESESYWSIRLFSKLWFKCPAL